MADNFTQIADSQERLTPANGDVEAASPVPNEPPPPYSPNYGGTSDVAPPSYDQAHDPTEPPPSYESIFGQVRAAKQESGGIVEFFKKFFIILLGTIGCTICVGFILAIPVSMIVMGAIYKDDCDAEKYIPIYLIVGGTVGVLKNVLNMCQRFKNRQNQQDDENAKTNPVDSLLNCFLCAWFIAGNVWIYRTYDEYQSEDKSQPDYCDDTLYWYAFWITTSMYIMMGTVCLCICCAGLLAAVVGDNNNQQ